MPDDKVEKLTPYADGKRRKMKMKKLTAVALTSAGANPEAHVTFFKSKDKPNDHSKVLKQALLVSNTGGHSHLIFLSDYTKFEGAGYTSWTEGHDHPFVIKEEGDIEIGMAFEHDHFTLEVVAKIEGEESLKAIIKEFDFEAENADIVADFIAQSAKTLELTMPTEGALVDLINKNAADIGGGPEHQEENIMPNDNNADNQTAKELDALKVQLAAATALATLNDAQKDFYAKLDDAGKELFLGKSAEDRESDMEVAKSANAVVYKSANGDEYFKNDDPRLVAMAKKTDIESAKTAKALAANAELTYKSRATAELGHLPGDIATHINLLKSIDRIEDEGQREAALATLVAKNESFAVVTTTFGTTAQPVDKGAADAEAQLDNLTKKHVTDNPGTNYFDAYGEVSEAHPELYQRAVGA